MQQGAPLAGAARAHEDLTLAGEPHRLARAARDPLVEGRHPATVASSGPEFEGAAPSAAEEPRGGGGRHVAGDPREARMAQRDADDDGAQRAMEDLAQGRRLGRREACGR